MEALTLNTDNRELEFQNLIFFFKQTTELHKMSSKACYWI